MPDDHRAARDRPAQSSDAPADAATRAGILRHFEVTRTPDGAWGLHPESPGYVFVTTLVYVALRLLGVPADDRLTRRRARWLQPSPGGVLAIPTWGKFWLAFLGLYDSAASTPCPPELSCCPRWLPLHPRRYYCHTRYIYLAMATSTAVASRADLGPIAGRALRTSSTALPRARIDFGAQRHAWRRPTCTSGRGGRRAGSRASWRSTSGSHPRRCGARALARVPRPHPLRAAAEPLPGALAGERAAELPGDLGRTTRRTPTSRRAWPVSRPGAGTTRRASATPARARTRGTRRSRRRPFSRRPGQPERHGSAAPGVRVPGVGPAHRGAARSPSPPSRDPIEGGWCFSDGAHRWPVSDCTAEAVSAVLHMHDAPGLIAPAERIPDERLQPPCSSSSPARTPTAASAPTSAGGDRRCSRASTRPRCSGTA